MSIEKNNYAFIDAQNVWLGIKNLNWKLDWLRFRTFLKDKYHVTRAFIFIGYKPGNEGLYTHLQQVGYLCVFKPILELADGKVKGNVDAELVLHSMIEFGNYDQAVIVTGDGDFRCLVEYLLKKDKLNRVLVPDQFRYSALLKSLSTPSNNIFQFMNFLRQKVGVVELAVPSLAETKEMVLGKAVDMKVENEKGSRRDETRREPLSS